MARKTTSKLDPHATLLDGWLAPPEEGGENMKLIPACERLLAERGVSVSPSRLSLWWAKRQGVKNFQGRLEMIASGRDAVCKLESEFAVNPPPNLEMVIKLMRVLIFDLAAHGKADAETLSGLTDLVKPLLEFAKIEEKTREGQRDERRLVLLEEKAKQADAARGITEDKELTAEEKAARMREVFGL